MTTKKELKVLYKEVLDNMTYDYESILNISKKSGTSWESCKNCLLVLEFVGIINSDKNRKNIKYKKKHLIDIEKMLL